MALEVGARDAGRLGCRRQGEKVGGEHGSARKHAQGS
jgi:hypothetical protein